MRGVRDEVSDVSSKLRTLTLSRSETPTTTTTAAGTDSPARRRLRAALASSQGVEVSPPPAPARRVAKLSDPATAAEDETLVLRTGAKVSGKYAVVTAFYRKPKLRFEIYVQSTCVTHEIVMTHADVETAPDEASRLAVAHTVVSDLSFDEFGKVVLGASVPAIWCS